MNIKESLPEIKENVSLAPYTSLKIGGPADYLFEAKSNDDLVSAIRAAKQAEILFVILGGGSNVLVSDAGFRGLVILARNQHVEVSGTIIRGEAGVTIGILVSQAVASGLSGLEWAAGLPGTLGGAVFGNAGTFGKAIGDVLKEVTVLDVADPNLAIKILQKEECGFGYRTSIFKKSCDVILSAALQLTRGDSVLLKAEVKKNISYRNTEHPPYQSAGCIFKNAEIRHYQKISLADVEGSVWFDRLPSGLLIDRAELKGFRIGDAEVSEKHGNFIMNRGHARAEDVVMLISAIKGTVHRKFGVLLEEEIRYIGF